MYKHNGVTVLQPPPVPGLDGMGRWSKEDNRKLDEACLRWGVVGISFKEQFRRSFERKKRGRPRKRVEV